MKTLFTDLYNRILEIFQVDKSENTSGCAVDRLQVILMHDRTKLDPIIMNNMREELINVFSKYVVIDKEKLEIDLTNEGDAAALMLNIPIVRAKTEEELEEIRKQIQEKEEKIDDSDDDSEADAEDEIDDSENESEEKEAETENEEKEEISEDSNNEIVEDTEDEIVEEKNEDEENS